MYKVVNTLYTANQAVMDLVTARANAFGVFQANVTAINANIANQSLVTQGVTADKAQARETLNSLTAVIFQLARVWALANNDLTNAGEFDFSRSEIEKVKDDSIIPFIEHRLAIINANSGTLIDYGITAALITQWQQAMSDFDTLNASPRSAIVSRKTSTAQLGILFKNTQKLLRDTIDPLVLPLKITHPVIYAQYVSSRIIIDRKGPGLNKFTVKGTILDAVTLLPMENATIKLIGPDIAVEVKSNEEGIFILQVIKVKEEKAATLNVSAPDYEPQSRTVTVTPTTSITEDFNLQPLPPPSPPPTPPMP